MTYEQTARLIRTMLVLGVMGGAITAGIYFSKSTRSPERPAPTPPTQVTKQNLGTLTAPSDKLVAINLMVDGNPVAAKLRDRLAQIKIEHADGDSLVLAELNLSQEKGVYEVNDDDLAKFTGQIEFYSAGERVGSLRGDVEAEVIVTTIDRLSPGKGKAEKPEPLSGLRAVKGGLQRSRSQMVVPEKAAPPPAPKEEPKPPAGKDGFPAGMQKR